jgi:tRNA threonylcarbamoyladenosine biosynthesis protein TsaE
VHYHIQHLDQLPGLAKEFLDNYGQYKVFAFDAEMGTGKTTFINVLLAAMGIKETEGSPTYSLVNVYDSPMFGKVYHMDVYRLKSEEEALDFGVEEMLYGGGVCLIEWPEKIAGLLPENTIWVYIRKNDDESRTFTIEK